MKRAAKNQGAFFCQKISAALTGPDAGVFREVNRNRRRNGWQTAALPLAPVSTGEKTGKRKIIRCSSPPCAPTQTRLLGTRRKKNEEEKLKWRTVWRQEWRSSRGTLGNGALREQKGKIRCGGKEIMEDWRCFGSLMGNELSRCLSLTFENSFVLHPLFFSIYFCIPVVLLVWRSFSLFYSCLSFVLGLQTLKRRSMRFCMMSCKEVAPCPLTSRVLYLPFFQSRFVWVHLFWSVLFPVSLFLFPSTSFSLSIGGKSDLRRRCGSCKGAK